jgi:radical SAM-linked protein
VGFIGKREVVDIYLNDELQPNLFVERLGEALPPGIRPTSAEPVARELPSLQSQVNGAYYAIEVDTGETDEDFAERLASFMSRPEAWRERRKGKDFSRYDLRPLVRAISYAGRTSYGQSFGVTMRAEPGATGRPDELLAELGLEAAPRQIVRLQLLFV